DDLVRVPAHEHPVLERPGLALGTVGDREVVAYLGDAAHDRRPLASGREPGSAPAPQPRPTDGLQDAVGAELAGPHEPLAGVAAHGAISLAWSVALAALLPRSRAAMWGALAGLVIAGIDLGVLGRRRWPRIRALPVLPQIADHVLYGALVGAVLSRTAPRR